MKFIIYIILIFIIIARVEDSVAGTLDPVINPTIKEFGDASLLFYLSFDQSSLDADIACGAVKPIKVLGNPQYNKGIFGKALFIGKGGKVIYDRKKNMPSGTEVGTICFWFCPKGWDLSSDDQHYAAIFHSSYPGSAIARQPFRRKDGIVKTYNYINYWCNRFSPDKKLNQTYIKLRDPMKNDVWTFFVLHWSSKSFGLSLNAKASTIKNLIRPISEYDIAGTPWEKPERKGKNNTFAFSMDQPGLFDEVMIFNRKLNGDEILKIYEDTRARFKKETK